MTEHTIEKHVENIYVSLRMPPSPHDHRRVLAVLVYLSAGYAPPGQHAGHGGRGAAEIGGRRSLAALVSQAPHLFPLTWKEA